ncbi:MULTISPECIES: ABC transporter permease [Cohnella]|uniref:ABC transporter permease n=1 Tax=Cohnella TaxID=329857 RepID=UPI0009BB6E18|nr:MULTISPECIES: ABC transporter permease subunit [Cohnella]MBN2982445.1 sugar ABC transporter permease [Cohnella algarum]
MIVPGLIVLFIYQYLPMFGFVMAFQDFKPAFGISGSEWVGWDNFTYALNLPNISQVVWNTFYISVLKVIASQAFPIAVAILLNEVRMMLFKRTVQTLIYLPHFLSWIIMGGILVDILSPSKGIVNQFLGLFGAEPIFFLGDADIFPYVLVLSDLWKDFGFNTIVYLAALTSINPHLYEAAVIDGANRWKQIRHVTLPGMVPIVVLVATLSLGNILNAGFDQVFNLYSPSVYETGDIIDTLVYRTGILQAKYALATAIGLFKSVVSFVLIVVSYVLAYRIANYRIF